jgi:hypothetical protein
MIPASQPPTLIFELGIPVAGVGIESDQWPLRFSRAGRKEEGCA